MAEIVQPVAIPPYFAEWFRHMTWTRGGPPSRLIMLIDGLNLWPVYDEFLNKHWSWIPKGRGLQRFWEYFYIKGRNYKDDDILSDYNYLAVHQQSLWVFALLGDLESYVKLADHCKANDQGSFEMLRLSCMGGNVEMIKHVIRSINYPLPVVDFLTKYGYADLCNLNDNLKGLPDEKSTS